MMNQAHPLLISPDDKPDCLLTLQLPRALESEFTDWLNTQGLCRFCLLAAHEMGTGVPLPSALEQVQGRAQRVLVQISLTQADWHRVLAALKAEWPHPDIRYWVQPLLDAGSLA